MSGNATATAINEGKFKEGTLNQEVAPELSNLDYAKNLMQSLEEIIQKDSNNSSEEFNERIKTLKNILTKNKIEKINEAVDTVLGKMECLINYEITREELIKAFSIFKLALSNWINEEENQMRAIEAIRIVGRLISENPEALYNAIFF